MTTFTEVRAQRREEEFEDFCAEVFASLGRTDQRHAAGVYLYGLLSCTGRKSIRRLIEMSPGRSEQSLQQFINQSPWDPEPIRQRLFDILVPLIRPTAWVIEEVCFPKHGRYSAAVERQYVPSLGRVCNCQLAITVTVLAEDLTVPVNWRLMIPEAWGRDLDRRNRARLPADELPRPYWQYQLEVLDDMALEWGMPTAPVMVDTANRNNVEPFLAGLEHRRQPYLVQVSTGQRVWYDPPGPQLGRGPIEGAGGQRQSWHGTVNELIMRSRNLPRETVAWQGGAASVLRSQFLLMPVRAFASDGVAGRPAGPAPQRMLLCEWPLGKARPRGFWLTNMTDRSLDELVTLAKSRMLAAPRIEEFAGQYGLRDYEGRTYAGWHHHVTLASAAYVYDVMCDLRNDPRNEVTAYAG